MPVIRPMEQSAGEPYPLLDGSSPTIGWQWLADRKGGPVLVVLTRTVLGSYKIQERFPLTDDGWAGAWRALARLSPDAAGRTREALAVRASEDRLLEQRFGGSPEVAELDTRALASLRDVTFLGGYLPGPFLSVGQSYDIRFQQDRLVIYPARLPDALLHLSYADIETVEVGGPGLVRRLTPLEEVVRVALFGVLGALRAYASTKIKTVVQIRTAECELFFLHDRAMPDALRIEVSPGLAAVRQAQQLAAEPPASAIADLARLASMLENGLLTREEFDTLKARILAG
jgi:hypothetical protein